MGKSAIEYTDYVWNPIDGCTPISRGCENCYAMRMADRFWGDRKFSDVRLHVNRLGDLEKWRSPRTIFACSTGDLFHKSVEFEWFAKVMNYMITYKHHRYLILTKRIGNMITYCNQFASTQIYGGGEYEFSMLTSHIWFGVSVEDQEQVKRAMKLTALPAERLFLSVEPMLGPVVLDDHIMRNVGLVICGSESGAKPGEPGRHFEMKWAEQLRDQCREYNVPLYLKQATIDGKLVKMPYPGEGWQELPWRLASEEGGLFDG